MAPSTSLSDSRTNNQDKYKIMFRHMHSGKLVKFVAWLTQFSDNYTSTWNEQHVYGRMDPISTFQRTGRQIQIGWKILNATLEQGKENMNNISNLINFTYPSYFGSSATKIQTGPVLKLKFNNLVRNESNGGVLGYLGGVSFTPNLEPGFIIDERGRFIPKELTVTCTFTVLHSHELGWNGKKRRAKFGFPYGHYPSSTGADTGAGRQSSTGTDTSTARLGTEEELSFTEEEESGRSFDPEVDEIVGIRRNESGDPIEESAFIEILGERVNKS